MLVGEDLAINIAEPDAMAALKKTQNEFTTHHTFMHSVINRIKIGIACGKEKECVRQYPSVCSQR